MSYDLRVLVKVEGCDRYAVVGYPEYDEPTYNLRDMFVACMDWDYEQGCEYPAEFALERIVRGVCELVGHPERYRKHEPANGWGSVESAWRTLVSSLKCIRECVEEYPIECLYFRW